MEEAGRYTLKAQLSRYHNLFLLKAFTKRYAMAGIRLGYGITENTELLDAMTQVTQPWNISVMAQAAGIGCTERNCICGRGATDGIPGSKISQRRTAASWHGSLSVRSELYFLPWTENYLKYVWNRGFDP